MLTAHWLYGITGCLVVALGLRTALLHAVLLHLSLIHISEPTRH